MAFFTLNKICVKLTFNLKATSGNVKIMAGKLDFPRFGLLFILVVMFVVLKSCESSRHHNEEQFLEVVRYKQYNLHVFFWVSTRRCNHINFSPTLLNVTEQIDFLAFLQHFLKLLPKVLMQPLKLLLISFEKTYNGICESRNPFRKSYPNENLENNGLTANKNLISLNLMMSWK